MGTLGTVDSQFFLDDHYIVNGFDAKSRNYSAVVDNDWRGKRTGIIGPFFDITVDYPDLGQVKTQMVMLLSSAPFI